jgi:hypothetical protein
MVSPLMNLSNIIKSSRVKTYCKYGGGAVAGLMADKIPNAETIAAMNELRDGLGQRFPTVAAVMADLNDESPPSTEESSENFITRMWKTVDRDEEYPETIVINTRDFHRLCEGYSYWYSTINSPDKLRTYELLVKIASYAQKKDDV